MHEVVEHGGERGVTQVIGAVVHHQKRQGLASVGVRRDVHGDVRVRGQRRAGNLHVDQLAPWDGVDALRPDRRLVAIREQHGHLPRRAGRDTRVLRIEHVLDVAPVADQKPVLDARAAGHIDAGAPQIGTARTSHPQRLGKPADGVLDSHVTRMPPPHERTHGARGRCVRLAHEARTCMVSPTALSM